MTTLVIHTYNEIDRNRVRLNLIATTVQLMLPKIDQNTRAIGVLQGKVQKIQLTIHIDRAVALIEQAVHSFVRTSDHYQRNKASLELGCLTELLLPVAQLKEILANALTEGVYSIEPIQWYYENVLVYPTWSGSSLVYKANLPLVDSKHYLQYFITSWEQPYNHSKFTIQLDVHQEVGLDTHRVRFLLHRFAWVEDL